MGLKCIICGKLFGCVEGEVKYECAACRLVDDCSIRHYFTTTNTFPEKCSRCQQNLRGQKPIFSDKYLIAWAVELEKQSRGLVSENR